MRSRRWHAKRNHEITISGSCIGVLCGLWTMNTGLISAQRFCCRLCRIFSVSAATAPAFREATDEDEDEEEVDELL